ncbi:hypothetical protein IFM89_005399 [Coptis chinensis]|uniref:Uncharacterized protein n=1 Tax=Coptis chinensis TaxID=261450 RepID=A0A835ME73_9MAGN|nr:hypothetical protein IFM89_005399 [Coptis chinensis]
MTEETAMSKKLEGKVAIITGGASGISKATARLFAKEGEAMVVIANIQDQLGQSVASSIGPHCCTYIHCDVTDENQVKSLVESTVQNYGHLDIMFSNAGIINHNQTILDLDLSLMDRLFATNVRGMAACVKYAARSMVESVRGLIKSSCNELGKYGIRVNSVSPGAVATPLLLKGFALNDKETAEKIFASTINLPHMVMKVNHVADAVLFLASDQSAFVTGHDLVGC